MVNVSMYQTSCNNIIILCQWLMSKLKMYKMFNFYRHFIKEMKDNKINITQIIKKL